MYITIEGQDASGKSTQAGMLAEALKKHGHKVLLTKEPGSPHKPVCKKIRTLLLDPAENLNHKTALFLFLADRSAHMDAVKNALDEGKIVISDRSSLSSLVYYAAGVNASINRTARIIGPSLDLAQEIAPDICFTCDADPAWSSIKLNERASKDRIEQFDQVFHDRVSEGFETCRTQLDVLRRFIRTWPKHFYALADKRPPDSSPQEIHRAILGWVEYHLERK